MAGVPLLLSGLVRLAPYLLILPGPRRHHSDDRLPRGRVCVAHVCVNGVYIYEECVHVCVCDIYVSVCVYVCGGV